MTRHSEMLNQDKQRSQIEIKTSKLRTTAKEIVSSKPVDEGSVGELIQEEEFQAQIQDNEEEIGPIDDEEEKTDLKLMCFP